MSRKAFQNLLERYLKGQCTREEQDIVRHWYDLLDVEEQIDLDETAFETLEERLWDKINTVTLQKEDKKKVPQIKRLSSYSYISIAAALVIIIAGAVWINRRLRCNPVEPEFVLAKSHAVVVVKNNKQGTMELILPDASNVKLFKGAQLTYPKAFNRREITLVGDALFDVKSDPSNPFVVFHEGMITRVLGTCFLIKSGVTTGNDEVIVYSGKVEVIRSSKKSNFIERIVEKPVTVQLTMNQRAVLNEKEQTLRETLAETPVPIEAKQKLLQETAYKEMTLSDLAKRLSDVYGITIQVKPQAKNITFTGDLSDMGLFNQLKLICNVTETTYHIEEKTIIIQ
ncbi:FecR family protein [Olivibacter ginsenosidimutans]|uniref:FecR family protein n=1 Tax=Olivibacter ginsenosidimutans TaxID=1176537 RepID=A0ABP9C7E4_9SPHI